MIARIAPYSLDESHQSFTNRGIKGSGRQYYGESFDWLVRVRVTTRHDRNDLFRNAQSIPPRRSRS